MDTANQGVPEQSEFGNFCQELEKLGQVGVQKEIAKHKAKGHPIFYSRNGLLIMEQADGHCSEYVRLEDGTVKIIREVKPRQK
jgi:hypothetical protein